MSLSWILARLRLCPAREAVAAPSHRVLEPHLTPGAMWVHCSLYPEFRTSGIFRHHLTEYRRSYPNSEQCHNQVDDAVDTCSRDFLWFSSGSLSFGKEGLGTLIHGVTLTPPIVSFGYLTEHSRVETRSQGAWADCHLAPAEDLAFR